MHDWFHPNKMHADCENLIMWYLSIRQSNLEIGHTVATVRISRSLLGYAMNELMHVMQLPFPTIPSTSTPSSAGGVTFEAVMAQPQHMDARLDNLAIELYQVNTCVSRIARWQARLGGFVASPSPSPEASEKEMTTSQWLTLCHSWQKGGVILGWWESSCI